MMMDPALQTRNDKPAGEPHYHHKHYIGSAHSFEIVNLNPERPNVAVLKTFFIDDTVNENDWQATWEGLKKDAEDLLGVPLVLQEDLEHPKFSVQQFFDRGTIFDFDIDEENHRIIVYVRITDPAIIARIQSGELEYVSPAVIPRGSEHLKEINGVEVLDRTLPLHLAIVGNPAYGKQKAKMSHLCTGDGKECLHRLKMMKVASNIYSAAMAESKIEGCVSRKIAIIKKERPSISDKQAAAIAYSMCRKDPNVASPNSGINSEVRFLTQIPLIKKVLGTSARLASTFEKIRTGSQYFTHDGNEGYWIRAQDMDVFVARNQSIAAAMKEQCGCTQLNAQTEKVSKSAANYHKTKNDTINCASCKFFYPEDETCSKVEGKILPDHISDLYKPKD